MHASGVGVGRHKEAAGSSKVRHGFHHLRVVDVDVKCSNYTLYLDADNRHIQCFTKLSESHAQFVNTYCIYSMGKTKRPATPSRLSAAKLLHYQRVVNESYGDSLIRVVDII